MTAEAPAPPEGFVASAGRGPFSARNGPHFHREVEAGVERAFFSLPRHCNSIGLIHGGMLATFLDGVLAGAVGRATGVTPVTIHLSVDYLDMGRAGEWVLGDAKLTRLARDLAFAEGHAHIGGRDLARASGVFKLLRRRRD